MNAQFNSFMDFLVDKKLVNTDVMGNSEYHFINRMTIQALTYLATKFYGLDSGYIFSQLQMGPFSDKLRNDMMEYFNMKYAQEEYPKKSLNGFLEEKFVNDIHGKNFDALQKLVKDYGD